MTPRFRFTPEMFIMDNWKLSDELDCEAAKQANAALDEYLKTCPRVRGFKRLEEWICSEWTNPKDTHEAILFDLRELEKPECEHEPKFLGTTPIGEPEIICRKCGVGLVQKWEAVKR